MPDRLTLEPETMYSFTSLTEYDVIMLAVGLTTPSVRAMAHLALSGPEQLERNAEKPLTRRTRKTTRTSDVAGL
jgi:hypothetical protein